MTVKTIVRLVEALPKTYHDVDMLQPLPLPVPPILPKFNWTVRVRLLPDGLQTRMAKANGTEEVVEEVRERTPAEVRMFWWVVFPLENPVGWYLWNVIFLRFVVRWWMRSRRHDCVR